MEFDNKLEQDCKSKYCSESRTSFSKIGRIAKKASSIWQEILTYILDVHQLKLLLDLLDFKIKTLDDYVSNF